MKSKLLTQAFKTLHPNPPSLSNLPSPGYTCTFHSVYTGSLKLFSGFLPLFYLLPVISLTSQEVILATFIQYLIHTPYTTLFF